MNPRVSAWRGRGEDEEFRGRRIHVLRPGRQRAAPALPARLSLQLIRLEAAARDGDRSRDSGARLPRVRALGEAAGSQLYLHWQADMVEELVRRAGRTRPVFILAHDMGTSVATELMARDLDGDLSGSSGRRSAAERVDDPGCGEPDARAASPAQRRRPTLLPPLQRAVLPPAVRLDLLPRPSADR